MTCWIHHTLIVWLYMNSHSSGNRQTCQRMCDHELRQAPAQGQSRQQVIYPSVTVTFLASASPPEPKVPPESLFQRVSRTQWSQGALNSAAVLSHCYVTLMQTRLSAADVQPGSGGLLSHWRHHTAEKAFNGDRGAGPGLCTRIHDWTEEMGWMKRLIKTKSTFQLMISSQSFNTKGSTICAVDIFHCCQKIVLESRHPSLIHKSWQKSLE